MTSLSLFFFFQAEDGIRDWSVTGVQTCALPISELQAEDGIRDWSVTGVQRSEEHTSELQSLTNLVCRLLLGSEEHTSELQSLTNIVCRLLLEKKTAEPGSQIRTLHVPGESSSG